MFFIAYILVRFLAIVNINQRIFIILCVKLRKMFERTY